jgi:hypothetical protein
MFVLLLATALLDDQPPENPAFSWVLGALAIANILSSVVGASCVLFTRHVQGARSIWLVGFFFALLTWSNVALVPLFGHYAFKQPHSSGPAHAKPSSQVVSLNSAAPRTEA